MKFRVESYDFESKSWVTIVETNNWFKAKYWELWSFFHGPFGVEHAVQPNYDNLDQEFEELK